MADSPLHSDLQPPRDPAALDRWLRYREDKLAESLSRDITRVVQRAVRRFTDTLPALTASGDYAVFDDIPVEWQGIVDERLLPEVEQMYFAGGVNVWASLPDIAISTAVATGWAAIVNESARQFLSQRRNFIVGVGDNLFQGVIAQVDRALSTGASVEDIKQSLERLGNFSEFRADTIARTEILTAYSAGNWDASVALGEYAPVEKEWITAQDDRVRETHRNLDGVIVPFGQAFNVGAAQLMFPRQQGGPPQEVINCRCVWLEYWPGDTRRDGSIVPERSTVAEGATAEVPQLTETQQQIAEATAQQVVQQVPRVPNRALHDDAWFRKRITPQWMDDVADGRDFFQVTDTNDGYLRAMIRDQGFNAKPTVLPSQQFDELADEGWTVVHRGINAPSASDLEQFTRNFLQEDDFYVGRGLYGNGVYTSDIVETAQSYADTQGLGIGFRGGPTEAATGRVLDIAIHPQARVIDVEDLWKIRDQRVDEMRQVTNDLSDRWPTRQIPHPYREGEMMTDRIPYDELGQTSEGAKFLSEWNAVQPYSQIVDGSEDVAKIAVMEGYDVIRVPTPRTYNDQYQLVELPDTYFVILNRGAVAVREVK